MLLDLLGDLVGKPHRLLITDLVGIDEYSHLSARLNRLGIRNSCKRSNEVFQFLESLNISLERFTASSRTATADRIGGLSQYRVDALLRNVVVVTGCGVDHFLGLVKLLVTSFDSGLSSSLGINSTVVHYALMGMLSVIIVSAFEAVGAILVIAMLILPGATASLLSHRLPPMFGITVVHALLSAVGGIHLATWLNCSPAGAMVVAGSVLFALAWMFSPSQGLLRRWLGRELDELDEEDIERLAKGV